MKSGNKETFEAFDLFENDAMLLTRLGFDHAPERGKRRGRHDLAFEVLYKETGRYAFFAGSEAHALDDRIGVWRRRRPREREIVRVVDAFAVASGLLPLVLH